MTRTFNDASFDFIDLSTPSPVMQWWRDLEDAWEAEQDKFIKDGEQNWQMFMTKKPEHKGKKK